MRQNRELSTLLYEVIIKLFYRNGLNVQQQSTQSMLILQTIVWPSVMTQEGGSSASIDDGWPTEFRFPGGRPSGLV